MEFIGIDWLPVLLLGFKRTEFVKEVAIITREGEIVGHTREFGELLGIPDY